MRMICDIGNTNIKIAFLDDAEKILILPVFSLQSDYFQKDFSRFIAGKNPTEVVISSVVPSAVDKIIAEFTSCGIKSKILTYKDVDIGIETDNPAKTGIDLLMLAYFAASRSSEAVIVNAGTATTITYVKDKIVKGVIIAPGLISGFESLINKAEKLKDMELKITDLPLGKNTLDSISIGVISGHVGMIRHLVAKISKTCKLFLSGGNAFYLERDLQEYETIHQATIKGMALLTQKKS